MSQTAAESRRRIAVLEQQIAVAREELAAANRHAIAWERLAKRWGGQLGIKAGGSSARTGTGD